MKISYNHYDSCVFCVLFVTSFPRYYVFGMCGELRVVHSASNTIISAALISFAPMG